MTAKGAPPRGSCGSNGGFYSDAATFANHCAQLGVVQFASWNFTPHDLPASTSVTLNDPLNVNTHASNASDPWSAPGPNNWPAGFNNVQFTSNTTPNGALTPRGVNGLTFTSAGGAGTYNTLSATVAADSVSIVCESPVGGKVQAMGLELASSAIVRVYYTESVFSNWYEKNITVAAGQKVFVGFIRTRITRVEVWNPGGGEGLASVSVHRRIECASCAASAAVNTDDLIGVITQWGQINTPCDFDGGGVSTDDLIRVVSQWGQQCPTGAECIEENPSSGQCIQSEDCGLAVCDYSNCVPSSCICIPISNGSGSVPGMWICPDDCCGRCFF